MSDVWPGDAEVMETLQQVIDRVEAKRPRTGIVYVPNRLQCYTIWYRGWVIGFRDTEAAAIVCMAKAQR